MCCYARLTSVTDFGNSGAFIVDPLNHYLGRRGEIFLTACCLTATPIGSGFAKSWQGLFAARFIMGIGIGAKNATVPIYSSEMAPARIRGALVMFWQLWVVVGKPPLITCPGPLIIVADRYLLGLLCQCHCQRYWSHFLASPTGFSIYPILHSGRWYLLLSRIPSLAHEAWKACPRVPIYVTLAGSSHNRRKRLLLLVRYLRGRS